MAWHLIPKVYGPNSYYKQWAFTIANVAYWRWQQECLFQPMISPFLAATQRQHFLRLSWWRSYKELMNRTDGLFCGLFFCLLGIDVRTQRFQTWGDLARYRVTEVLTIKLPCGAELPSLRPCIENKPPSKSTEHLPLLKLEKKFLITRSLSPFLIKATGPVDEKR